MGTKIMSSKGLGRGLESVSELANDGPDLSSYVSVSNPPIDSPRIAVLWMIFGSVSLNTTSIRGRESHVLKETRPKFL